MFFCDFYNIFLKGYFTEHLQTTASESHKLPYSFPILRNAEPKDLAFETFLCNPFDIGRKLHVRKTCRRSVWCVIPNVFLLIAPSSKSVCTFFPGDGIGGNEELIGDKSSPEKCIDACIAQRAVYPDINGVTIPKNGTVSCYCERKMTSRNSSVIYKSCLLKI